MNKELEALDRLTTFIGVYTEEQAQAVCKDIDLIKKSLKEWKIWKDALETGDYECPEKKALEIIKNHYKPNFADNNYLMTIGGAIFNLTKEEYDLLKEVLL